MGGYQGETGDRTEGGEEGKGEGGERGEEEGKVLRTDGIADLKSNSLSHSCGIEKCVFLEIEFLSTDTLLCLLFYKVV